MQQALGTERERQSTAVDYSSEWWLPDLPSSWICLALRFISLIFLVSFLCLPAKFAWADINIEIDGIDDSTIEDQVRVYIGQPVSDKNEDVATFVKMIKKESSKALQAVGYYLSSSTTHVIKQQNDTTIRITIHLGQPVRVARVQFILDGEAKEDPEFLKFLASNPLSKGKILNHGDYEKYKSLFSKLARSRGYFDAGYLKHRIEVIPKKLQADILLHFDSGRRYQIGEIIFDESPISRERLQEWVPFPLDAPYESKYLSMLTNSLRSSGYFKSVRAELQQEAIFDENKIPLHVKLVPNKRNSVSLGLGFATDTGARGQTDWSRPYVNSRGDSVRARIAVSQVAQSLSAEYKVPFSKRPETRYLKIKGGIQKEILDDSESRLNTISLLRHSRSLEDWQKVLSLRWEQERFKVTGEAWQESNLLLPGMSWSKTVQQSARLAEWGYRYNLILQGASRQLGSDIDLQKITASGKWLWKLSHRHRFLSRAELGFLSTNDFNKVPITHRFFTGGDQSIRGFDYQTVSSKSQLVGGRYLTVGSLEYNNYFSQNWGWAVFVDAGRAFNKNSDPVRRGVGFGMRWNSPIGLLRIDVGFGISEEKVPKRLHISIGPQL
ncbi:MAG: autotransporter assembly complex protein TamA [Gammaproteobacteria bacterium]|nr:autotransporter assembly complex protein TamA [Gammaproteobacteria bacterium]